MKLTLSLALVAFASVSGAASADIAMPLASHRAAYEISLGDAASTTMPNGETPVAASGLIAYEFRGSACEGYASTFRQLTELQRGEGDPIASDIRAVTFEDGDARSLKFEIDTRNPGASGQPISGSAVRAESGATAVELAKPAKERVDIGNDILFPTQHIERIIAMAKRSVRTMEARVYDGSDSGKKVFATLTVIGKETTGPGADGEKFQALSKVRRWPVSVSYFDESAKDAAPEYVLSFDLYENGVSGTLKLNYGTFALKATLSKLEWLPTPACAK